MANTYTYTGPGARWTAEDATAEDYLNVSRVNVDHVHEALNTIMDSDAADGIITGLLTGVLELDFATGLKYKNTTANKAGTIFVRASDDKLVVKKATGTTTPPTPSDEDDYDAVISEMVDLDAVGPSF